MIDLIIHASTVVTMDDKRRVIEDGAIAVSGGRILAVGRREDVERDFPEAAERMGGAFMAALPGFIDGHSHCGHGLVRALGAEDFLPWRAACRDIYLTAPAEFWRAEARLSALERLKSGVTTAVQYLGGGDENNRSDTPEIAEAYSGAFTGVGPRLVLGVGPNRPPYPTKFVHYDNGTANSVEADFETQFGVCRTLLEQLPGGRVRVALTTPVVNPEIHSGPHFNELCNVARRMKALAEDHGAVLMSDGHSMGTPAYFHKLGILNERTLLSHAIDLDATDIALVAETGATISHNAMSNTAIWGRCPVPELIAAGAHVIVSTDGLAPRVGSDMFRLMRACMDYHRQLLRDPHQLPPGRVMAMTTREPARFYGVDNDLGSLEVGKVADLILVDLRKPHLWPAMMPLYQLAYSATAQDVDTVVIDGKVAMRNRKVLGIDEDAILTEARAQAERALERTGLTHLLDTPVSFWDDTYHERKPYAGPHGTRVQPSLPGYRP
jgi:cytosine/adenosine deaminase-related metal-dependent hydrolase